MTFTINNTLQHAIITKRPSESCKTPYMADIHIDNEKYLAHSPSLGCSGLTDKDCQVLVSKITNDKCKSSHKIQFSILKEYWQNQQFQTIICTNPQIAEDVIKFCLENNLLDNLKATSFKSQTTIGNSRFDFTGVDHQGNDFIAEVKTVPVADYHNVNKQTKKKMIKNNSFYDKHPNEKVAIFPDGYVKPSKDKTPKPQSERANKHILELTNIKENSNKRTIMFYVVQRSDASSFTISDLDPVYKQNVKLAQEAGVELYVIQMHWSLQDNNVIGTIVKQFDAII